MVRNGGSNPDWVRTATGWELSVNGVKVLDVDENGLFKAKGDMQSNEDL